MKPYFQSLSPNALEGYELDQLLALGFYRMHQTIFTVSHIEQGELFRVHWLRYKVSEISQRATHKRIITRAKDFRYTIDDALIISNEHKQLHSRYRASINFDGASSIENCLFGERGEGLSIYNTKCVSIWDRDKLIASSYFDVGETAAASIINFFDPLYAKFSLGKYLMLLTIDCLKDQGYEYYYPGYVVEGLSKMDYKLFLGREVADYFDPEMASWKKFDESILVRKPTEGEELF